MTGRTYLARFIGDPTGYKVKTDTPIEKGDMIGPGLMPAKVGITDISVFIDAKQAYVFEPFEEAS